MKLLIINGPNLNFLGIREPLVYGTDTYEDLCNYINDYVKDLNIKIKDLNIKIEIFQSNHEGDLVDRIQQAYYDKVDGIVINPAAYTHTSIALLDALKAVMIPAVEVHISDLTHREDFRQISYVGMACVYSIKGHGFKGYLEAIDYLINYQK